MSDIVLSSSVRQNLLSLQSTADLLSTTQSRLATGKKVNTALDNPTNYFTASALDSRASDINNLLDGIGNGVQILQAANTGITSLQKLVDSAKSVANQALQTTVGYNQKSAVTTTAIAGATADNLLGGASAATSAAFAGSAATASSLSAYTSATTTPGTALKVGSADAFAASTTLISALTDGAGAAKAPAAGDAFSINGKTITFAAGAAGASTDGSGNVTIGIGQTIGALLTAIDGITGGTGSAIDAATGQITLSTGTTASLVVADDATNPALAKLGLSAATTARSGGTATTPALSGTTLLSGTASTSNSVLSTAFAAGDTIKVNGTDAAHTLTFVSGAAANANEISIGADVSTLLSQIDALSGGTGSAVSGGKITLNTGTASNLSVVSSNVAAMTALGLGSTGTITQAVTPPGPSPLEGKTLTIGATGVGGTAVNITFGAGGVKSLNDLNAKLSANNLQATLSTDGKLSITTSNDAASATIGTIGGTAADAGGPFNGLAGAAPTSDPVAQLTRANLVTQYNNIIDQIRTTAQDSSFNGVNLLNGDQLKLTFNETGSSTLNITGVVFNPAGLGLGSLTSGTDFIDNQATNKVLASLNDASGTLRSQASALGSNLSVVQIRQDFSKNLINVLQTGSANLTLADTNEEAANSQALATRQSIAVSALALANQSQQSVLQLLR